VDRQDRAAAPPRASGKAATAGLGRTIESACAASDDGPSRVTLAAMTTARDDLRQRLDAVESAYEYMLAFAAQGLPGTSAARDGGKIQVELGALAAALDGLAASFDLGALAAALDGLAASFDRFAAAEPVAAAAEHSEFRRVLDDDARKALAAVRLVLAQPAIGSQLVDNLNASLHLRALLTDVFLVDEILDVLGSSTPAARAVPGPERPGT
jgi:hypothetical protein